VSIKNVDNFRKSLIVARISVHSLSSQLILQQLETWTMLFMFDAFKIAMEKERRDGKSEFTLLMSPTFWSPELNWTSGQDNEQHPFI
jgi:hypothetical protein